MSHNPLQNYFRQPKIYLKLPTLGKFISSSVITGDVEKLQVYGMNGMDQIIIKTPDALLHGESTVRVIQSCCPGISNGWELSNIDIECLMVAIRIATHGNTMQVESTCSNCKAENTYDIELGKIIEFYSTCTFDTSVVHGELIIKLKPLTYKQATEIGIDNFTLKKQISKIFEMEDSKEKQDELSAIYVKFGVLHTKVILYSIDYIETPDGIVSEFGFIKEWLDNCDQEIISSIRKVMDRNLDSWKYQGTKVQCNDCGNIDTVSVEFDNSVFFGNA